MEKRKNAWRSGGRRRLGQDPCRGVQRDDGETTSSLFWPTLWDSPWREESRQELEESVLPRRSEHESKDGPMSQFCRLCPTCIDWQRMWSTTDEWINFLLSSLARRAYHCFQETQPVKEDLQHGSFQPLLSVARCAAKSAAKKAAMCQCPVTGNIAPLDAVPPNLVHVLQFPNGFPLAWHWDHVGRAPLSESWSTSRSAYSVPKQGRLFVKTLSVTATREFWNHSVSSPARGEPATMIRNCHRHPLWHTKNLRMPNMFRNFLVRSNGLFLLMDKKHVWKNHILPRTWLFHKPARLLEMELPCK